MLRDTTYSTIFFNFDVKFFAKFCLASNRHRMRVPYGLHQFTRMEREQTQPHAGTWTCPQSA